MTTTATTQELEAQEELPGMPPRPEPLWEADGLLASEAVRLVDLSLTGTIELSSSEPGHHLIAEGLKTGSSVYLQVEGAVTKRGVKNDKGLLIGLAAIKVNQAVRADEAAVLALQDELKAAVYQAQSIASLALTVLSGMGRFLPIVPKATDESKEAEDVRRLLASVDALKLRAHAVQD